MPATPSELLQPLQNGLFFVRFCYSRVIISGFLVQVSGCLFVFLSLSTTEFPQFITHMSIVEQFFFYIIELTQTREVFRLCKHVSVLNGHQLEKCCSIYYTHEHS